jgi:hypothetical protein
MLLTLAMKAGTIAPEAGQSALLALIATMAIGPILIQQNAKIAQFIGGASRRFRKLWKKQASVKKARALAIMFFSVIAGG